MSPRVDRDDVEFLPPIAQLFAPHPSSGAKTMNEQQRLSTACAKIAKPFAIHRNCFVDLIHVPSPVPTFVILDGASVATVRPKSPQVNMIVCLYDNIDEAGSFLSRNIKYLFFTPLPDWRELAKKNGGRSRRQLGERRLCLEVGSESHKDVPSNHVVYPEESVATAERAESCQAKVTASIDNGRIFIE